MEILSRTWRGVPPEGVEAPKGYPTWREEHGFTEEEARKNLRKWHGADWTLERQVTSVSAWTPVTVTRGRMTTEELVGFIDTIPAGDPEAAHGELDQVLVLQFDPEVQAAVARLKERVNWWASA